jgi:predicted amidohydrolase YtcJ
MNKQNIRVIIYTMVTIILFSGCSSHKKVDFIVKNAVVYTSDSIHSAQNAFAVLDGKFEAVGSNDDILKHYSSDSVIDAAGKTILPGLMDAHCHFTGMGEGLIRWADLRGTKSFEEVIARLQVFRNEHPQEWLLGRGWDQNDWKNKEFPVKDQLDKLFPDIPVALTRIDGHAMVVNSKALEIAGITNATKVNGGEIKLTNGQPNGMLLDNAKELVSALIPALNEDLLTQGLLMSQDICLRNGLTSVVDAGLDLKTIQLIDKLQKEGKLKIRVDAMLNPTRENDEAYLNKGIYKTDKLIVHAVKLYADGALGSRGALLIEPYADEHHKSGLMIEKPEYYKAYCQKAYDAGFQVNIHAIGDSAVRMVLNTFASVLQGKNDRRWRVEHAQVIHPDDFKLFKEYSIIPSVQPTHATSDMYWAEQRLGPERIKTAYAYKQLLDQNGWMPLGTDFPIENVNPLYTFYAATARKDLKGFPDKGFEPENALTREEALQGITCWAARGSFLEKEIGSIEAGKFADFIMLDTDIMKANAWEIPNAKVLNVFIAGERVFDIHD